MPNRDDVESNIDVSSARAKHLKAADVIFIDEAATLNERALNIADRFCQRLRGNSNPFGGLLVLCSGDCRQCLPIVPVRVCL